MRWNDEGYLVSFVSTKENSSIVKIFTKNYGIYSGAIFGSTSKKKKPELQLGNKIKVNYNSKSEDALGYFSTELIENISIRMFNDNQKLNLLLTSIEVISKIMPDRQPYLEAYDDFEIFVKSLENDSVKSYLVWEFNFLKSIGYGLDLNDLAINDKIKKLLTYQIVDFEFSDLINIYDLNTEIISNRLVEVINISNFKNRLKIRKYLNE